MSRRTQRLHQEVPGAFVAINAQDAEEKGIREGDRVRLESRRGELQATARLTEDTRRGVLFMPWHFAESAPNLLTGPTAGPPSKMPELKYCAVRMEAVR
jgi:formate dehydrogenase major subunit